jgi:hypothetical protein
MNETIKPKMQSVSIPTLMRMLELKNVQSLNASAIHLSEVLNSRESDRPHWRYLEKAKSRAKVIRVGLLNSEPGYNFTISYFNLWREFAFFELIRDISRLFDFFNRRVLFHIYLKCVYL